MSCFRLVSIQAQFIAPVRPPAYPAGVKLRTIRLSLVAALIAMIAVFAGRALYDRGYAQAAADAEVYFKYHMLRAQTLEGQASKRPAGGVLVLGDSIVELQNFTSLCGLPVFNAGISGLTTDRLAGLAPQLVAAARPRLVVVAIGANDTRRDAAVVPEDRWRAAYRKLLTAAGRRPVIVVGVQPIEKDKPGAALFDGPAMAARSAVLARIAHAAGAAYVPPLASVQGLTVDGVHLNAEGDRQWQASVEAACEKGKTPVT